MTTNQLIFVVIAAVLLFAALAAFGIAFRQSKRDDEWRRNLEEDARRSDAGVPAGVIAATRASAGAADASAEALAVEAPDVEEPVEAVPAYQTVEAQRVLEVSPEEAGILRRQFLNRAMAGTFFSVLGIFGLASFGFMWPRVKGGFGADIDAGDADEIRNAVFNADGSVTPLFWPEAKSWIVPISDSQEAGSQFSDNATVAGGLAALWQKCVHLGCRVPWCQTSQGFECPCHGSKYNRYGEWMDGPAPRGLDRFPSELDGDGNISINTGVILTGPARTARVLQQSPEGPNCVDV